MIKNKIDPPTQQPCYWPVVRIAGFHWEDNSPIFNFAGIKFRGIRIFFDLKRATMLEF